MLYPSIFIYNYIYLFLKNAKKSAKTRKTTSKKSKKKRNRLKTDPASVFARVYPRCERSYATFGVFARLIS